MNGRLDYAGVAVIVFIVYASCFIYDKFQRRRSEKTFAESNKCAPLLARLDYKWPLAIDLLIKAFKCSRESRILRFLVDIVQRHPPTFQQKLLGQTGIDTVEPRVIEAILGSQFTSFGLGDRQNVFGALLGNGIFTQDGPAWKHSRNLLRPLFLSNRVDHFIQIQEHVEALISNTPSHTYIDFQPLFFRFTLDTTTFLLFGRSMNALGTQNQDSKEFADSFRSAQETLAQRGRLGPLYWLIGGKKFRQDCRTVHDFVDEMIKEAMVTRAALGGDEKVGRDFGFLGALLKETQDAKVLRDQMLNMLLAGRDTTACCLTWTMRLLVKHQHVLTKLRKEIDEIVGTGANSRQPSRVDLKKMIYLSYVLKEVLRLYPSVPLNSRSSTCMTTLPSGGGPDGTSPILVREGEAVGYCIYAMHRRRDLYGEDAEQFRPERWDAVDEANTVNLKDIGWGYLPFNGGPRVCLGQEFALLEASYLIVRLLQTFSTFECDPSWPIPEVGEERQDVTLVLASADGCHVRVS
ncbi:hypothetical protein ACMFMG_000954 [Clarireedia jacksonii]